MAEEAGKGVCADIQEGENAITLHTSPGDREHLHTCALRKAMLASPPTDRRREIYQRHGLPQETPNTTIDRERLEDELELIRY
jgi:DNA-binding IclR family transcriptional regulator